MRRRIALQKHFVQKSTEMRLLYFAKLWECAPVLALLFGLVRRAYAPMRRKLKVVSGLITSPFISSKGYARKLIGPLCGSGSTTKSRPFVSSKRFAGLWPK